MVYVAGNFLKNWRQNKVHFFPPIRDSNLLSVPHTFPAASEKKYYWLSLDQFCTARENRIL